MAANIAKKIAPIMARMMNAGMDANDHMTMNTTISPKGILKPFT
jgi:hypothetical protein|tara:strand:+ start:1814 stop:1945 length:132 start_codon:yes stop_codon:yes gene_type:complete